MFMEIKCWVALLAGWCDQLPWPPLQSLPLSSNQLVTSGERSIRQECKGDLSGEGLSVIPQTLLFSSEAGSLWFRVSGFKHLPCDLLSLYIWASHLTCLSLLFLSGKRRLWFYLLRPEAVGRLRAAASVQDTFPWIRQRLPFSSKKCFWS